MGTRWWTGLLIFLCACLDTVALPSVGANIPFSCWGTVAETALSLLTLRS